MEELERVILDMILEIYKARYNSKIKIVELKDQDSVIGYHLELGMNNIDKPITINKEGTICDFIKCVEQELHNRRLNDTIYSLGYKVCN